MLIHDAGFFERMAQPLKFISSIKQPEHGLLRRLDYPKKLTVKAIAA